LGSVGNDWWRGQSKRRKSENSQKVSTRHCCGHLILRVLEHELDKYIFSYGFRHTALVPLQAQKSGLWELCAASKMAGGDVYGAANPVRSIAL
jgi:hypothetical protein